MISRIFKIVLITFLAGFQILSLYIAPGFSFFQANKKYSRDKIPLIRQPENPGDDVNLVFYGTNEKFNSSSNGPRILFYKSKNFNSVDEIKINSSSNLILMSSVTTEESISELIYANLKLKKILDDYKQLKNEKRKFRSQIASVSRFDYNLESFFVKPEENIIEQSQDEILDDYAKVIKKLRAHAASFHKSENISKTKLFESLNQMAEHSNLSEKQAIFGEKRILSYADKIEQPDADDNKKSIKDRAGRLHSEKVGRSNSANYQVTWISNMIIGIIEYTMKNKFESLFFFLVILMAVLALTSSKTK